ncbi:MAG: hypothetical protein H6618_08230 [Deltaproteobacteria bacterium]|nr:hypothetical protein [Deltaproteobacteria bacterium]
MLLWTIFCCLVLFVTSSEPSQAEPLGEQRRELRHPLIPPRRTEQAKTSGGHILTPAAARIPGIGFFYGGIGGIFNLLRTETDLFAYRFWGDMSGGGLGLTDIMLNQDSLSLNLFYNIFDRASVEVYPRGMDSSREDRLIRHLTFFDASLAQLNWRILDRRLQFNIGINRQREQIRSYSDQQYHNILPGLGKSSESINLSYGSILDLSDDRSDPHKGAILEVFRYDKPRPDTREAWFYTLDYNATFYIPVLSYSTLVFNAYRSDAIVRGRGEESPESVSKSLGIDCEELSGSDKQQQCRLHEERQITDKISERGHGTAIPLGGTQRMQAFPTNRFYGAHSQSFGTEFRLNLTRELSPFNIGILSGIRTGLQLAAFCETGTVADASPDLLKQKRYRSSCGGGVRLLLASGFVIRGDIAHGSEGQQFILIFQYPWNVF